MAIAHYRKLKADRQQAGDRRDNGLVQDGWWCMMCQLSWQWRWSHSGCGQQVGSGFFISESACICLEWIVNTFPSSIYRTRSYTKLGHQNFEKPVRIYSCGFSRSGLNNLTAGKPYLSLCYVKTEGKLVTQPFVAVQVANIISYSALTHGSIKASGWRDTIRVVEEKEVTKVSMGSWLTHREVFEVSDYKFPEFTEKSLLRFF